MAQVAYHLTVTAEFLEGMADALESWARQSRDNGWSTHQVDDNRRKADQCRQHARSLRQLANQTAVT